MKSVFGRSVWYIFSDCFQLLMENLTLFWPFLGLITVFFLMNQVLPDSVVLSVNPILIAVTVIFWAVIMAFMAGIYNMAYQAVWKRFYPQADASQNKNQQNKNQQDKTPNPFENLLLLTEFFPGVGAYAVHFFFGGLIHLLFVAGLLFGTDALIQQWGGLPDAFYRLQASPAPPSVMDVQNMLLNLSPNEFHVMLNVSFLIVGSVLLYAGFSLLTMLWPAMVIGYNISAPKAYLKSVQQFFRAPLLRISITIAYFSVSVIITVIAGLNGLLAGLQGIFLLMNLLWLMLLVSYTVIYFLPSENASVASDIKPDEKKSTISYDA